MGRFAEDSVYSNAPSPTTGAGLAILASNQRAILELPGAQTPQLVTIADGAITPTGAFLRVDTEGQAAADDLTIINVALSDTESLHDGMIVYMQAADSGRVVTVKNTASAGGISTYDGQDAVLGTDSWLTLQLQGGQWVEVLDLRMREGDAAIQAAQAAADTAQAAATAAQTTADGKANKAMDNITTAGWTTAKNTVLPGAGPGAKRTDFTLPSSGGTVTATWTGYIIMNKNAGGADKYIILRNNTRMIASMAVSSYSGGPSLRCFIPVTKGDSIVVEYTATGTTNTFVNISLGGLTVQS